MADVIANTQTSNSILSSSGDDIVAKPKEEIAEELANDFCKFLTLDVVKEEGKFNDSIESMLIKLDEFFSLVDMVRSDTALCLLTTLPDIQTKCAEIEAVFEKIDKLEEFVTVVRDCVNAMEAKVTKAENDLGTVGSFMRKFNSLVGKKSPVLPTTRSKRTEYVPVDIFSTAQYFDHSKQSEQQLNTSNTSGSSEETHLEEPEGNPSSKV